MCVTLKFLVIRLQIAPSNAPVPVLPLYLIVLSVVITTSNIKLVEVLQCRSNRVLFSFWILHQQELIDALVGDELSLKGVKMVGTFGKDTRRKELRRLLNLSY